MCCFCDIEHKNIAVTSVLMPTGRADGDTVCMLPCVCVSEVRSHGGVLTAHLEGNRGRHMGDKQKKEMSAIC